MGLRLKDIVELATGLLASHKIPYTTGSITRLLRLDTLADWILKTYAGFLPSGIGMIATDLQTEIRNRGISVFNAMTAAQIADVTSYTGALDVSAAIQTAHNTGKPIFYPDGLYNFATQITNTGDFVAFGAAGSVQKDYGNGPLTGTVAGPILKWTGANATVPILFNPDVARRLSIRELTFWMPEAFSTSVIKPKGGKWFTGTFNQPQLVIRDVAGYRYPISTTSPGASTSVFVEFDLTDTTTPRAFFGVDVDKIYAYGFNQVYKINVAQQTTPASGNWFNANSLGQTQAYKCYKILNVVGVGTSVDVVQLNTFGPWRVQPGADGAGTLADGIIRLDGNVSRNSYHDVEIFDVVSGRRYKHTNPVSATNISAWNITFNCADFESDASAPMLRPFGGGIAGITYADTVLVGSLTDAGFKLDVVGPSRITGDITNTGSYQGTGSILTSHSAAGVGYTTGAGGTIAQGAGSGKATAVTLHKSTGLITMDNANLNAATSVSFTLNSSAIAATDTVILNHSSGGTIGAYTLNAQAGATLATITVRNITAGNLAEALVLRYTVIKSVSA